MNGLIAAAILLSAGAIRSEPTEASVEAVFLPKFARYVQWPGTAHPGPQESFVLCVIGDDPFGAQLDSAASNEVIDRRSVAVRRLASPDGAEACHVAFVRGPNEQDTERWLLALRNLPVLTVTAARFGPQRGIIHFTIASGRVRFFIDDSEAAERGLTISSRLLALALGVRQRRR